MLLMATGIVALLVVNVAVGSVPVPMDDVLNLFEQKFSRRKMMGKRIGIFWDNLLRRSSTTKLVTE